MKNLACCWSCWLKDFCQWPFGLSNSAYIKRTNKETYRINRKRYIRITINTGVAAAPVLVLAKVPHVFQVAVGPGLGHVPGRQLLGPRVPTWAYFSVEVYLHRAEVHFRPQLQLPHVALRPQHLKTEEKSREGRDAALPNLPSDWTWCWAAHTGGSWNRANWGSPTRRRSCRWRYSAVPAACCRGTCRISWSRCAGPVLPKK